MKHVPKLFAETVDRCCQRGSILPLVTIALAGLMAMIGLVVDSGQLYLNQQKFQNAADSAALAAALEVSANSDDTTLFAAIDQALRDNGLDPARVIRVVNPTSLTDADNGNERRNATSQGVCGPASATEVEVLFRARDAFITAFMRQPSTPQLCVKADYTEGDNYTYNKTLCLLALNTSSSLENNKWGLKADKKGTTLQTCGIHINNSDKKAMQVKEGVVINATYINVVGGTEIKSGKKGTLVTPKPVTGATAAPDPFAGVDVFTRDGLRDKIFSKVTTPASTTAPTKSCDYTNYYKKGSATPTTLSPGLYCGGIWLDGGNFTLSAGTYILLGNLKNAVDSKSKSITNYTSAPVSFLATGTGSITGSKVFIYSTCGFGRAWNATSKAWVTASRVTECTNTSTANTTNNNWGDLPGPPPSQKPESQPSSTPTGCTADGSVVECRAPGTFQILTTSMAWSVTGPERYRTSSDYGIENVVLFADRAVNNKNFVDDKQMAQWNILGANFVQSGNSLEDSVFYTPKESVQLTGTGEFYGSVYGESIYVSSKLKMKKRKAKAYIKTKKK